MPEAIIDAVPALLVVGPGDVVVHAATRRAPTRSAPQRTLSLYAVVHRGHGPWTHVYAVEAGVPRDRCEVRLLKVMAGDRLEDALQWAAAFPSPLSRPPALRTGPAPCHAPGADADRRA